MPVTKGINIGKWFTLEEFSCLYQKKSVTLQPNWLHMVIRRLNNMPTDAEYIQAFRANDNATITRFYRQYREDTYSYVLKDFKIRLEEDREDIFQEAVTRLWENVQRGKLSKETLTSSLYVYFRHVVDNVTKEHIRKQMHYLVMDIENERVRDVDNVGMEKMHYTEDERVKLVRRAVNEMGTPCAPLLLGFLWDKKSMATLAEELGYSGADSAKTQKSKCMDKLDGRIRKLLKSEK